MDESKWYLRTQDETFGPETETRLVEWAKLGRIQPGQEVSSDNIVWQRVEDVPFLDMRFSIDIGDGNPRGPFNRAAAEALLASGRLPKTSTIVEVRAPFEKESVEPQPPAEPEAPAEQPVEQAGESVAAKEPETKVVEKVVEKIVEKVVEVPVEKIIVDETRVKELEGLLDEERRHTSDLQSRLDDVSRKASEAAKAAAERECALKRDVTQREEKIATFESALKDAADRENKYAEQVRNLEDELRRLPQAASEVADIQAAVYSIITGEAVEIERIMDAERREFEEVRKRFAERADRLQERRRELLRRSGANIEEMTRKALLNRPEDPRTAQLRKELEELRRVHDHAILDRDGKIRELTELLRQQKAEGARAVESAKDVTQLRAEVQDLHERLQAREKELFEQRERVEEMNRQQATRQQALLARLASLESPSIGSANSLSTNQSREARQVKLPGWMSFRK